jgi:hypothetical protein
VKMLANQEQPGFDFICEVPATWDETWVLSGQVGEYIVVLAGGGGQVIRLTPIKTKEIFQP